MNHHLNLRSKRDVLVPPYDLQSRKSCCCLGCSGKWAILERISGFDPSLEMINSRYWKFCAAFSRWPFILISLWKPFGLLSSQISTLYLVVVLSRRSTRTSASSYSSAFTTMSSAKRKLVIRRPPMSSAKRKLVIRRPPMLTLSSWSPNVSQMILSRKMLKRVGESRYPCRTPTVGLNQSAVLPLNRTALCASHTDFQWLVCCWHLFCSLLPISLRAIPCQRPSWSLWRNGRDSADVAGVSRSGTWDWIFVLWCSFTLWNQLALLQWSLMLVDGVCLGWSSTRPY